MKIQLETIPVWDGLHSESECYLCDLAEEAQKDALNFYLGPSVMNPETRVKVNKHGFCPTHWNTLVAKKKAQAVALMSDTYLKRTRELTNDDFDHLLQAKNANQAKKAAKHFEETLGKREKGCLICTSIKERLERYLYTTCYLWGEDPEFRKALANGNGFCLHHFNHLLQTAPDVLDKKEIAEFTRSLAETQIKNLDRIADDVYWMTQKYKSENKDKPWGASEDAHKRGVEKMVGTVRVIDPV
ncbi:MAG: DUF6062 family protein [Sphaerochaeta sp.]